MYLFKYKWAAAPEEGGAFTAYNNNLRNNIMEKTTDQWFEKRCLQGMQWQAQKVLSRNN